MDNEVQNAQDVLGKEYEIKGRKFCLIDEYVTGEQWDTIRGVARRIEKTIFAGEGFSICDLSSEEIMNLLSVILKPVEEPRWSPQIAKQTREFFKNNFPNIDIVGEVIVDFFGRPKFLPVGLPTLLAVLKQTLQDLMNASKQRAQETMKFQ